MCYSTDFLVCINIAPRNNGCGAREFFKLLTWIFREIWHILKTLDREIVHFFPWIRLVPTDNASNMRRAFDAIVSFHDEEMSLAIKCITCILYIYIILIWWYLKFDEVLVLRPWILVLRLWSMGLGLGLLAIGFGLGLECVGLRLEALNPSLFASLAVSTTV